MSSDTWCFFNKALTEDCVPPPHKGNMKTFLSNTVGYLLLVVRQHLIGSQVLTRCPPLFVVHGIQAVVESRSSREIDNIPQI